MRTVGQIAIWSRARFAATLLAAMLAVLAGSLLVDTGASRAQEPGEPAAACPTPASVLPGSPAPSATSPAPTPATGPYRPAAEEIVVCVGTQGITGATFAHWAVVAERSEPAPRHPALEPDRAEMEQVLGFLISSQWVFGEAEDLGVKVTDGEVARHFDRLRRQQFPKHAEFRRFLARSGQTVADLLLRVKLSILTERIQRRVTGHGGARSQQRTLSHFVTRFRRKWKAQTYCEPQYAVIDCGHTASPL
jgi:hypothetical protein